CGSAGVDMETTIDVTLTGPEVQLIPSNMKGTLGHGLSALLVGRSSIERKGIFVLPGIIDADYTGVIQIMVHALIPPVHIPAGSKIGQLVPFKSCVPQSVETIRGDKSFGSTGAPEVMFTINIGQGKPQQRVTITAFTGDTIEVITLIDIGADITIIS
ncbi:POK9 protein, partial [Chaetops frenatus]|nr:POK9 protein [Chaetops frenatus]